MVKLHLSKAYYRLNWNYLKSILTASGFCDRWVNWIYEMVSTPNFSILLNGSTTPMFNAKWGLWQGDPISSFLFIIAAKGLERYLKKEPREGKIKGLRLLGNNLPITHQQFVDNIMIFCAVSLREVKRIKWILDLFTEASGTEINREKSCTFLSKTPEAIKRHLTRTHGILNWRTAY